MVGATVVIIPNLRHYENPISHEKQVVTNVTPGIYLFVSRLCATKRGILQVVGTRGISSNHYT